MSRRLLIGLAALGLGLGAAGCGSDGSSPATAASPPAADAADSAPGGLAWVGEPVVFTPEGLPSDRIVTGKLRNDTGKPLELRVDRVEVRDGADTPFETSVRFVQAFGHGLYGPGGPPAPLKASQFDQKRLGERVVLEPGAERPVTVAWRLPKGSADATQVQIGSLELPLPAA